MSRSNPINAADIPRILGKNKYTVDIITPATRKTSGKYTNRPNLCEYFASVANKLREYENITIEHDELESLFADMTMSGYIFESRSFALSGKNIPSIAGNIDISIKRGADKLKLLFGYATYSGIGAKTTLGMGGFLIRT
jgi:CRISPR/Cas system endoribonuclease Cas6 (RAMP superfamily)